MRRFLSVFDLWENRGLNERITTSSHRILIRVTGCLGEKSNKRIQEEERPRQAPKNKNRSNNCGKGLAKWLPDCGLVTVEILMNGSSLNPIKKRRPSERSPPRMCLYYSCSGYIWVLCNRSDEVKSCLAGGKNQLCLRREKWTQMWWRTSKRRNSWIKGNRASTIQEKRFKVRCEENEWGTRKIKRKIYFGVTVYHLIFEDQQDLLRIGVYRYTVDTTVTIDFRVFLSEAPKGREQRRVASSAKDRIWFYVQNRRSPVN